jgi:hypothetical protein
MLEAVKARTERNQRAKVERGRAIVSGWDGCLAIFKELKMEIKDNEKFGGAVIYLIVDLVASFNFGSWMHNVSAGICFCFVFIMIALLFEE